MEKSKLYDQTTFYRAFERDLRHARFEVIIESPFITVRRTNQLLPILARLRRRGVTIIVNTRNPIEHDDNYHLQALRAVASMQSLGIKVLYTVGHHRKIAVIDREIVWEGSLNILSFYDSCEIMRRIASPTEAKKLIDFIGMKKYVGR